MSDIYQVHCESVAMMLEPDSESEASSEIVYGEKIEILEDLDDWVLARCLSDDYEGYIPADSFTDETYEPTHKIKALRSFFYLEPDFKTPPLASLPFFGHVKTSGTEENGFVQLYKGGWLWKDHLYPAKENLPDIYESALKFLNAPYLWGGRTSSGIDCSALVQLALLSAGVPCPRDTKDQVSIGKDIKENDLQKGDLVFFDGHVGFADGKGNLLNATARTMDVRIETLSEVSGHYGGIKTIKRVV